MAFSSTVVGKTVLGRHKKVWGTFTNTGGSTGGNIDTELEVVDNVQLDHTGSSVVASAPSVNETLPGFKSGSAVTIVTVANADGTWEAIGRG